MSRTPAREDRGLTDVQNPGASPVLQSDCLRVEAAKGTLPRPWSRRQTALFGRIGTDTGLGLHSPGASSLVPALEEPPSPAPTREEPPAHHLWLNLRRSRYLFYYRLERSHFTRGP
ncbi:hypothetical protein NDU88_004920 [Pleurodeles waltl]|uniref:Uncharacterized protein n=1 Tax=Pleurodeles waltl TaxID=8319 RepID=A0AAV7TTB6_PLEWA|nr:hypothetical protein NDU88_004920 [Pleurodeles waltl]